jgi:cation:H+ antiporter
MMYFLVLGGFVLLLGGAEVMLRGAVGVASKFGISKLVVGMTVVAFGTSAPELLVSLNAALQGSSGLAIGNVVGSNIANIFLVLGVAGLLMPITVEPVGLKNDGWMLLAGTGLFIILALSGKIEIIAGLVLLAFFICFFSYTYWRGKKGLNKVEEVGDVPQSLLKIVIFLVLGFAGLIYGADILVEGCVAIARNFGVTEAVIGLTIIAFGTSLPELAATLVSAFRRQSDVALGNVVGSNIFNVVGIVGVVSAITPLDVPARVMSFDLWVMLAATLMLMPYMIGKRVSLGRLEGSFLFFAYSIYMVSTVFGIEKLLVF